MRNRSSHGVIVGSAAVRVEPRMERISVIETGYRSAPVSVILPAGLFVRDLIGPRRCRSGIGSCGGPRRCRSGIGSCGARKYICQFPVPGAAGEDIDFLAGKADPDEIAGGAGIVPAVYPDDLIVIVKILSQSIVAAAGLNGTGGNPPFIAVGKQDPDGGGICRWEAGP